MWDPNKNVGSNASQGVIAPLSLLPYRQRMPCGNVYFSPVCPQDPHTKRPSLIRTVSMLFGLERSCSYPSNNEK